MKKTISFLSLLLCLPLLICGLFFLSPKKTMAENEALVISTPSELFNFINAYNGPDAAALSSYNVELGNDINMSGYQLLSSIGTETIPFSGTFDGKGYTISNLSFQLEKQGDLEKNGYAGFFGYAKNATIKNLHLDGNFDVSMNANSNTYIGMLVGQAENVKIDSCYLTADFSLETVVGEDGALDASFKMLNFGGLAGNARDSEIKNCIVRQGEMPTIQLDNIYDVSAKVGGVVGNLENSSVIFTNSANDVNVDILDTYAGRAYIGGIVGYVSQANSKIINCVTEDSFSVPSIRENYYVGIIGGYISKPAPSSYNISYVYYYYNGVNQLQTFGNDENYSLNDAEANLVQSAERIREFKGSGGKTGVEAYFASKVWNPAVGDHWDFKDVWLRTNGLTLQAFKDSFSVSATIDDNLTIVTPFESDYRYDDVASFTFRFNESVSSEISKYYQLANIVVGSTTVGTFRKVMNDDNSYHYELLPTEGYQRISMTEEVVSDDESDLENPSSYTTYTITIEGITQNYEGNYKINISPIEFQGSFNYKLYDGDKEIVEDIKSECYVFYKDGQNQTSTSIIIGDIIYNNKYVISTTAKNNSVFAFDGWYLVGAGEDGTDKKISTNRDLNIQFGQGDFTENFEIYAKYISDACRLTFVLSDGVEMVSLASNQYLITESDTQISILKQLTQLKMELYIKPNFEFNVDLFVQELNTYEVKNPEINFCTLIGEPTVLEDGTTMYEFNLNLDNLNDDDYGDGFSITFNTEPINTVDTTLIWIIVGSVGGGLLLIGLIILIVVLARRHRGGGGSIKKSSYKNMYY